MTSNSSVPRVLTSLLLAAIVIAASGDRGFEAAQERTTYAVSGTGFCATTGGDDCLLATAVTIDQAGTAAGALVLVLDSSRAHVIVSARHGRVEATGAGLRATFSGAAVIEETLHEFTHVVQQDAEAQVVLDDDGRLLVTIGEESVGGRTVTGGVAIRQLPDGSSSRGTEHWVGVWHTFDTKRPPSKGYGFVWDPGGVELPDIAGLFKDTADGETGHAHGHLDFLKRSDLSVGFDARGNVTCVMEGGDVMSAAVSLQVDVPAGILDFRAPRCRFREALPIRELPCPQPCRRTTIVGPGR
jgi:hypothetical protein